MPSLRNFVTLFTFIVSLSTGTMAWGQQKIISEDILKVGKALPNVTLKRFAGEAIQLDQLKGKIKIISIVPQLNTPVCDEQTHRFSEKNGGLDQFVDIITLSTNSAEGQKKFAQKAKINNLIFLSDAPEYDFGKATGLLNSSFGYLKRTVIVVDENNIIRYVDFVPGGGLPNIEKALASARMLLEENKPS
ncbi:MAG: putative thiol peroxidase [Nitrospinaceae bacterium]|nr:MAG: putative thiol peroxidase [Nitrospinaceae bacterium]